jgi:glycosyltransferase involved in cell wall biosynthesis
VATEGMSTGLPVVASNVDGLREVLDESNPSVTLVNQAESVDDWVSAIRKAIADVHVQSAQRLAQSSRQQAENALWTKWQNVIWTFTVSHNFINYFGPCY